MNDYDLEDKICVGQVAINQHQIFLIYVKISL